MDPALQAEMEVAKKLGVSGEARTSETPSLNDVARPRISLLCYVNLGIAVGAALFQLLTIVTLLPASCDSWIYHYHLQAMDIAKTEWIIALMVVFFVTLVPSAVVAVIVSRRKWFDSYFVGKFQFYHKIMLGLAVASFLGELGEMTWLALVYSPPFGNYNCEALSAAVFLNSLVVIAEFARVAVTGLMFHFGKAVQL